MVHARLDHLCAAMIVAGCALTAAACATTIPPTGTSAPNTAAPQSPTAGPLSIPVATPPGATPWPFPAAPENCGQITVAEDGNVSPVLCPDGRPSVAAITFFAGIPSKLLSLGRDATAADVLSAACDDLNAPAPNGGTIPLVTTEATLAFAENRWNFGPVTSPEQIDHEMFAGACSPAATPAG
jgi:hypothetical protein